MIPFPIRRRRSERLGAYAPVPFVGAACLLVALIIFTPVLLASGPSPLAVQAVLSVYRVPGGPSTEFYVHAVGSEVPYAKIDIALGTGFPWTGSCPSSGVLWNFTNESALLGLSVSSTESPVVVYATAVYNATSSTTIYAGEVAFDVLNLGLADETLSIVPCTTQTPGESTPSSWSVSKLPLPILLVDYGSGGPP